MQLEIYCLQTGENKLANNYGKYKMYQFEIKYGNK